VSVSALGEYFGQIASMCRFQLRCYGTGCLTLVAFHGAGTDEFGGSLASHIQDTESFNQKQNIQDLTWEQVQNEWLLSSE
jgi:hypothetical protein